MDETLMIHGCINKDREAEEALYNKYSPLILGICYRYCKCIDTAEDMLQDSFIKIFREIKNFRNKGSFEGWIRTIAVHTCLNLLKKNKTFSENIEIEFAKNVYSNSDNVHSLLQTKQVIECIRMLPIGYRTIINLYAIEGYSHKEIGEMLDIKEGTSRSQYTRARAMLQHILLKKKIIFNKIKIA